MVKPMPFIAATAWFDAANADAAAEAENEEAVDVDVEGVDAVILIYT